LGERRLLLFQIENFLAQPSSGEKGFSIEDYVAICRLRSGRLEPGRCRDCAGGGLCGSHRIARSNPLSWTACAAG
jgi:hypothetical protein